VQHTKKLENWIHNKRALSPIFATVLLAAIVIIFGAVAYYYASNVTTNATNQYVSSVADSQQSISERVDFENIVFTQNPANLNISIINCGITNNLQINTLFVYDSNHQLVGYNATLTSNSPLRNIDLGTSIVGNCLLIGKEAYFTARLTTTGTNTVDSLPSGSYTIHLITQGESSFDYPFIIP
jgi:flagellin-like protein